MGRSSEPIPRSPVWRRRGWAWMIVGGCCLPVAGSASSAQIRVEFLPDGRCTVSATGEGFHSNLTYLPQTKTSPTTELRCAIPPVPERFQVYLTVMLPPGIAPSSDDSPHLTWIERDSRWIGTASLPTAPAVVRIPEAGSRGLLRWILLGAAVALAGIFIVLGVRKRAKFTP